MKLSKNLISGIAATTIIGAVGLAYAQTVTPPETPAPAPQSPQQQQQPQTPPATTPDGGATPSGTAPGMNTDAIQSNDGQPAPRADRN